MRRCFAFIPLLMLTGILFAAPEIAVEPLPEATSNNAVAIAKVKGEMELFSFMGIGAKKTWNAVTSEAYTIDVGSGKAYSIHPVPGTAGRIGAMAIGAGSRVFLFGGYVLYQGGGMAVPDVNIYEPPHDRWSRGPDMPVAVGDAVIGIYRDRYIYLVGGRSGKGPVSDVQMFDVEKNRWSQATPMPGTAVFGHAGGLVGETILYVDGAGRNPAGNSPRFVAADECWSGKIDHHNPAKIAWTKLPSHPGTARFRIAAGSSERDEKIYFSGGTDNPYDYDGIGYDGKPSEPSPMTFAFDLHANKWETLNENTLDPTMDHRGLLVTREGLVVIGGMEKGQQVTARVVLLSKEPKAK
ncbi:MAG: kelch repeat-containing protein [Terriglobales bacterium]